MSVDCALHSSSKTALLFKTNFGYHNLDAANVVNHLVSA